LPLPSAFDSIGRLAGGLHRVVLALLARLAAFLQQPRSGVVDAVPHEITIMHQT
jgi:hypothetical protein